MPYEINGLHNYVMFEGDSEGVIEALQNLHATPPWFIAPSL